MAIFDIFKRKPVVQPTEERSYNLPGLSFNFSSSYNAEQAMRLSAVYCAVNQISNSIAMLPIQTYKWENGRKIKVNHSLNSLLNEKPQPQYTHFQWMKLMVESLYLKGNAYSIIQRDEQLNVTGLIYVDAGLVVPVKDPMTGNVKYIVQGVKEAIDAVNMIHLYFHLDGMGNGISVIRYASMALEGAMDTENTANAFYRNGGNLSGVIKASSPLNNQQKKEILESWRDAFTGSNHKIGVAVLPGNLDFQPISVNPADAELLANRKYDVITIARFFNISPIKLMVMDDVNYNSMEMAQNNYLQETLLPVVSMILDEFNVKLFKPSQVGKLELEMDFEVLLKADKKTEADYYRSMLVNGIMTLNEVREKVGLEPILGEDNIGDKHWLQVSYATMEDIAEGKFIKQKDVDQSANVNNQAK